MSRYPTAAVIGAGSSGIAAAKALRERGVPHTVFEASDRVGGVWVFGNRNGLSAAYRGLHINTSRDRMEFSDFPMPKTYPDYPHHTQIAAYFDAYTDHFGLRDRSASGPAWSTPAGRRRRVGARAARRATERFDALLVANGHHWNPRWPEPRFPGSDTFSGTQMHAHDYREPEQLTGRRVVVLGMGNSAMDIAVESSYVAERTFLAARRGAWIVPKYLFGKPTDQLRNDPADPGRDRGEGLRGADPPGRRPPEKYGLPKPDHAFGEAHPTVSGRIIDRLQHGAITPKPNIARLDGDEVVFADGSRERVDVVVYCTGYKITFPFFDDDFIAAPDNRIELFRRVFHPDIDNVFFVALLQPLGAIMPIAEARGSGSPTTSAASTCCPARAEMLRDIREENDAMRRRYVASKRHTIQVDFDDYLRDLERERHAGRRAGPRGRLPAAGRAARGGQRGRGGGGRVTRRRCRQARAHEGGQPRRDPRAARDVFADIGYGAASVRDIVRRTDLASGTFYNYFPDKESVLRALVDEIAVGARARVRTARAEATTLEAFVADGFRAYFAFLAAGPADGSLMRRNAGTIRTLFDEPALGAGIVELREDLDAGVAAGLLPAHDTGLMAAAMVGAAIEVGLEMVGARADRRGGLGRGRHLHLRGRVPAHAVGMGRATAKLRAS